MPVRVETLAGTYLYAIKVFPAVGSFDLCPADACQTADGVELVRAACAVDAPKTGLRVEGYEPPAEIVAQVESIAQRASLDIGGIEYLIDERDGRHYFYDINALSNFVADAERVVGFDPWEPFVDYLVKRGIGDGRWAVGDGGLALRASGLPVSPPAVRPPPTAPRPSPSILTRSRRVAPHAASASTA